MWLWPLGRITTIGKTRGGRRGRKKKNVANRTRKAIVNVLWSVPCWGRLHFCQETKSSIWWRVRRGSVREDELSLEGCCIVSRLYAAHDEVIDTSYARICSIISLDRGKTFPWMNNFVARLEENSCRKRGGILRRGSAPARGRRWRSREQQQPAWSAQRQGNHDNSCS